MQKHLTCHSQLDLHRSQGITYVASEASGLSRIGRLYLQTCFTDAIFHRALFGSEGVKRVN